MAELGNINAASNPALRPRCRRKKAKNMQTVIVAANAEGSRALHGVTSPNGQLHSAMATYIPGGLVKSGSPKRVGTIQLPERSISRATMARNPSVRTSSLALSP